MTKQNNFAQVPNKMFAWDSEWKVTNDELLVYVMLQAKMQVDQINNSLKSIETSVSNLVYFLGFTKGTRANQRVQSAIENLREKGYIQYNKIENANDFIKFTIPDVDLKEVIESESPWTNSGVKSFSGFTKIEYNVIGMLLKNYDMTLFSYTSYRHMDNLRYRISFEEWSKVLGLSKDGAFRNICNSQAIVKINNGYDKEQKRRETNSYLPFTKKNKIDEFLTKPFYVEETFVTVDNEGTRGEKAVESVLSKNSLLYIREKEFKDCLSEHGNNLRFDFYTKMNDSELLVEFDGKQHFVPVGTFGGKDGFKLTQLRDSIKTKYAEDNKIPLLRIPYWEIDNVEKIVEDKLKELGFIDDTQVREDEEDMCQGD